MKCVLTAAGSDSSGGAGIQADLKTMTVHGVYGMSVITALTAQNTTGVSGILEIPGNFVSQQMDSVFTDIRPDAVKIGMVSGIDIIQALGEKLREHDAKNIVLDPVMVASSGARLLTDEAVSTLIRELIPLADVVTPNIPEAEVLSGIAIRSHEDMERAASLILKLGCRAVLVKGGHLSGSADDLLYGRDKVRWFRGERFATANTHGTGCTLSSALASNLALGLALEPGVLKAKAYVAGALRADLRLGKGCGPLNHMWDLPV